MEKKNIKFDCDRGCTTERLPNGELKCELRDGCCKLSVFDWLERITDNTSKNLYEVRFKNTRKAIFLNNSGESIRKGDIVVVQANSGHDVGIVTLEGAMVTRQMLKNHIDPKTFEFKQIYRKAKKLDLERWQEAISREHDTMIQARKIASSLKLNMKIGDVEFQGDGTKAIFYYIADERVDFRQLIKDLADAFHIRIEMRQIGARQETGLIGGLGVCGRELCCAGHINNFRSITTQTARIQDLSLNPQKLAGQCGKLKCCINYEAAVYMDARNRLPRVNGPIELKDGNAYLMKTDILKGTMYFSYDSKSVAQLFPLQIDEVKKILSMNANGEKPESLIKEPEFDPKSQFVDAVGVDNIERFDKKKKKKRNNRRKSNSKPRQNKKENNTNGNAAMNPANPNRGKVNNAASNSPKASKNNARGKGKGPQNRNMNKGRKPKITKTDVK
ncbi:MAG: regulatory iron-sulfur-containing complex subunit RicT [Bacteroidales bacterium]